jgi:hypothetical protein
MLFATRRLAATTLTFVVLTASPILAQSPSGRIVGRVVDASTGAPIPGAQVTIEGTSITAIADWSGRYGLYDVPAGSSVISVRMIGYQHKTVRDVVVQSGAGLALDLTLTASAIQIAAIEVSATEERGSAARALDEQRTSNQIINAVSGEQIRKSPDSDAGQAVQRVSGVSVQDGRYVFVRGLGERYTTTALNGARIPSPEPERKVVPLDLFPSGLLDGIVTAKTFTPDQPGDFSGAQVDLRTRDFLLQRVVSFSMSGGMNDAVTGTLLPFAPTEGSEWLGLAGDARSMPSLLASNPSLSGMDQTQINGVINTFRNVWSSRLQKGGRKGSFAASIGGSDPVFGRPLDYLASLTYSNETEARVDERRALAGSTTAGDVLNAYHGATGRMSVLWGGILNLSTPVGSTGRLRLENTYTHSGENEALSMAGFNNEFNQDLDITRLTFVERTVRSHQLRGDHMVGSQNGLDWEASASSVRRYEPDRSDLVYQTSIDSATGASSPYAWFGSARSAVRTFNDLNEHGYDGSVNYRHLLGRIGDGRFLKVGAHYRAMTRDAHTYAYDIINAPGINDTERQQTAEAIFQGTYADQGKFFLAPDVVLGTYTADDQLAAGYGQLELQLSAQWKIIGGARVEYDNLVVESNTQDGFVRSVLNNTDVLPALSVTYSPTQRHNLRFSLSQTLARPEYREISPVTSFDPLGGQSQSGNPALRRGLIRNADVRWEWYPSHGQVLSAGVFAKRFIDPIERILISSAATTAGIVTWVNADHAQNYGLELELRSSLGALTRSLQSFGILVNTTLMRSSIEPGNDSLSSLTSPKRAMVGQAKYVVNAGLTYGSTRLTANVLYNVVGPRIREAAIQPLPDVTEQARQVVDVSLLAPVGPRATVKFDAKNILDAPYRLTQGAIERHYFRTGRVYTLGISWTP